MGCNGWNHAFDCDCGWGGVNYSGTGGTLVNLSSSLPNSFSTAQTKDAETYSTTCPWCNHCPVYYHSNGYGDSVYFDSLGWPWPIHSCWEKYWKEERARRRIKQQIILNNLNPDEQKCLILAGVIQKIKDDHQLATEHFVAYSMGLFTDQFRKIYRNLYTVELNLAIMLCEPSPKKHEVENKNNKNIINEFTPKKHEVENENNKNVINKLNKINLTCPICNVKFFKNVNLKKHMGKCYKAPLIKKR